MKDRVGKRIITEARRTGLLAPGAPIVESSSGTMALGVALVGTALGHPVHIVTDPRIDPVTLAKLEALGCTVHVVAAMDDKGWQGARLTRLAEIMRRHPGAFWPRQYENPANPAAYAALADELTDDLGRVDVLVGSVGSGGSLCGSARRLRATTPDLRVVGVDCVGSVLFGQPDRPQRLQSGLGNSLHPANLDLSQIDEVHWLNDHEAFSATRTLAREQKLFCGNTSGSVYRVAAELAARAEPGRRIVGIFPDRGDRYTDTVYSDEYWDRHGVRDLPLAGRPRRVSAGEPVRSWSYLVTANHREPPVYVFVESNTTGSGMVALRTARRLGFEAWLLTSDPGRYQGMADTGCRVVRCDTNDLAELPAEVPAARVAAISSLSEFYVVAAARLAARAGLPLTDPDVLAGCRDKGRLRHTLAAAGVRQPDFAVVTDPASAAGAAERVGVPCVVKPVDESGSTGVLRCDTAEEAVAHATGIIATATNVRGQPAARAALVERYLSGTEFSVESFTIDGVHHIVGIVGKSVTGAPHFVEHRHIVPAELPAEAADEMVTTVRRALTAAGLERGPAHTEVKLTPAGASVIEINPRLAGGMIPELLRMVTGADMVENQIRAAVGLPVELPGDPVSCAGIQFLLADRAGILEDVEGVDAAEAVDGVERVVVTASPGRAVRPPRDAYDRLGYVTARGASASAVTRALSTAAALVRLRLSPAGEGEPTIARPSPPPGEPCLSHE
jgi:cysteine synthase A